MPDNLIDIEGIGAINAKTLGDASLKTTDDLLKSAGSAVGRKNLAAKTSVSESKILEWVNRADLMRIKGVGSEFSDLLEASGVEHRPRTGDACAGKPARQDGPGQYRQIHCAVCPTLAK